MLAPETAKKRLAEFKRPEYWKLHRESIKPLSDSFRFIAKELLGFDHNGRDTESRNLAVEKLDALPQKARDGIFRTILPGMADITERAWKLQMSLPYYPYHGQLAFRCPSTPVTSQTARTRWLETTLQILKGYEHKDIIWLAQWAPYLDTYWLQSIGILLAAAIDAGGDRGEEVFQILVSSINGTHEVGAMGRHAVTALLTASRHDGWEVIEKLLLAAQRQEGVRQIILESVHLGHPEAFRRMIHLIRDQNLIRFSSVLRAVGVWFGFVWDVSYAKNAASYLDRLCVLMERPVERKSAIQSGSPSDCYIGLWCTAFENALDAIDLAAVLLRHEDSDRRFATATLLTILGLRRANILLANTLDDADLRVAYMALSSIAQQGDKDGPDCFPALERLISRSPLKKQQIEITYWPWIKVDIDRQDAADRLPFYLRNRSPKLLLPYIPMMEPWKRAGAIKVIAASRRSDASSLSSTVGGWIAQARSMLTGNEQGESKPEPAIFDPDIRELLFVMIGDASENVRQEALNALSRCMLTPSEAIRIEGLLTRKPSDLRTALIKMLLGQTEIGAADSAGRLLESKNELQRSAGLEIAQIMVKGHRAERRCLEMIAKHETNYPSKVDSPVLQGGSELTLENGLGLYDPSKRTKPHVPRAVPGFQLVTPAAKRMLVSLDNWIQEHKDLEYDSVRWWSSEKEKMLLGSDQGGLVQPNASLKIEDDLKNLQLRDLWQEWWNNLPSNHFDLDGGTAIRAYAMYLRGISETDWTNWWSLTPHKKSPHKHSQLIRDVLRWMIKLHPPKNGADICLDGFETDLTDKSQGGSWRDKQNQLNWLEVTRFIRDQAPQFWRPKHDARFYEILRWVDQPTPKARRSYPLLTEVVAAISAGAATSADLFDQFLGPISSRNSWRLANQGNDLSEVSGRRPHALTRTCPLLQEVVDQIRVRLVELELKRGEMETQTSPYARMLRYSGGAETLFKLFSAFGKNTLVRSGGWRTEDRGHTLSHLIRATYPSETDTPESFAESARNAKIAPARLMDLAVFAPHWARHVGAALDWPDLDEAVWWVHAHTKDDQWSIDVEMREAWKAEVSLRTPLDADSLVDGAVDVEWFQRIHAGVSADKWKLLDGAAKYASSGGGHKRAQLYADAMLGRVSAETLLTRITEKRNGDAVRAFGLVPLAAGDGREADVLARYYALQEFLRSSKEFGSMRQTSERLAVQIAMDNLARTAGYPDPLRLQWAMERKAIGDLAKGPIEVQVDDLSIRLQINALGEAVIDCWRGDKTLKTIPAATKKLPEVKELTDRRIAVGKQARRMRSALEEAMVRGDVFRGAELATLLEHPVLARMLRSLVFVGDGIAGYLSEDGHQIENHKGQLTDLDGTAELRIAHPIDLATTGEWHLWQKECFLHERVQPFKQVYRELYVVTEQERTEGERSLRYAGHQVNPRQALAIIGKRGWVARPEEGVGRVYHKERIVAQIEFDQYFTTPADVEGLTVQSVYFHRRGEWDAMKLEEVPKRLFSEVMRDVDLMVSVAHQGGVDPEASASTVEMRATLVMETCRLLKINNVKCEESHARIDGKLTHYSVHLGSAVVHTQPGGHLCIVPVHSQHRGRLFLPFVDDDPRTAEVVSKVLLLAKDSEIKDPIILEQIMWTG